MMALTVSSVLLIWRSKHTDLCLIIFFIFPYVVTTNQALLSPRVTDWTALAKSRLDQPMVGQGPPRRKKSPDPCNLRRHGSSDSSFALDRSCASTTCWLVQTVETVAQHRSSHFTRSARELDVLLAPSKLFACCDCAPPKQAVRAIRHLLPTPPQQERQPWPTKTR